MEMVQVLAHVYGALFIASGLGVLVSRDYYWGLSKQLRQFPLAMLLGAFVTLVLGMLFLHVEYRVVWSFAGLIALLNWMTFLKGAIRIVFPEQAMQMMDFVLKRFEPIFCTLWAIFALFFGFLLIFFSF